MPVRTAVALVLATGLVASLAACTSEEAPAGACQPTSSGSASESVSASGDFGTAPTLEFASPLSVETTQRSVLIDGSGDRVAEEGELVFADFTLYNGTTGEQIEATDYTGSRSNNFTLSEEVFLPGIVRTLSCASVGDRVVGVVPPAEGLVQGSEELGISATDSLVFVFDVHDIMESRATGEDVPVEDSSLPTVTLGEDGTPTLTIPDTAPPAEFKLAVLKQGDGVEIADGDTVWVQYQGTNWNTGTIFDQSWGVRGPTSFATSGVIPGFTQALVGQKVGSQVLAVIPPDLGYGPSGGTDTIGATDTIVFVIDILGVNPVEESTEEPSE